MKLEVSGVEETGILLPVAGGEDASADETGGTTWLVD